MQRDLCDGLLEGHEPRTGEFVNTAGVPILEERGDGGIRNVVGIEEGLSCIAYWQRHRSREDVGQEGPLGEVLCEPAAAQHRHFRPRRLDDFLGP